MNHKALAMATVAVILFGGANIGVIPNVSGTQFPSTGLTQGFDTSWIGPTAAAAIALIGTRWVVGTWQKRKDINKIRKEVLASFLIIKSRAVMMDNFVAELIMQSRYNHRFVFLVFNAISLRWWYLLNNTQL